MAPAAVYFPKGQVPYMAKKKKKKKIRSVLPLYSVATTWLVFALFFDLYALSHYITAGIASFAAFVITSGIFPTKEIALPEPPKTEALPEDMPLAAEAPDAQLEILQKERDRAIGEMRRLNQSIQGAGIAAKIDKLEALTAKIIDHVVAHPDKRPQIRKFLNYYLPTTIKLLNTYDRMGSTGVSGEHIGGTMKKIEDILDTIIASFEKQLDSLFANEAMDISTDIVVMENLLAQEGLTGAQI